MQYELWGLFASSLLAATLLPGGSEIGLAWLVSQTQIPIWKLLLTAIVGNSLGGIITFASGWLISRYYPAKIFNHSRQFRAKQWLQNKGAILLIFSWLPIIGDPLCLLAGWLRLNAVQCCAFIVLGKAARYWVIAVFFA
ncbi:MAG: hypothetical protein OFPII_26570 [Osedax symbiont Rs1]|nr:MAG: hypothetical protein OFPII_26570 [Osedax symbiont Rs1]